MGADVTSTPFPLLAEIVHATARYLGALTVLDERALAAPSALPGWTRGHVVAHLSRNADAMTRVLCQAAEGEAPSMYETAEGRDRDIDATVVELDAGGLVADALESAARFEQAAASYRGPLDVAFSRVVDGPAQGEVADVGRMRRTEVEVHHADLLLDYTASSWPEDFSRGLIGRRQDELGLDGPSMVLSSTDVDGLWKLGSGAGPEVRGTAGDLAWWLVGRGGGSGLVSSTGELPTIPRWR
jgi:maleylpyruvate isomerase